MEEINGRQEQRSSFMCSLFRIMGWLRAKLHSADNTEPSRAGKESTGERSNHSSRYTFLDQTEGPDPCPTPHPLHCWQWRQKISLCWGGWQISEVIHLVVTWWSVGSSMPLPVGRKVYLISCLALANEEKLTDPQIERKTSKICHSDLDLTRASIYIMFWAKQTKRRRRQD